MTFTTQAWGHDGKTYDGKDMRQLVEAMFYGAPGVVHGLNVTQQGSPNGTVQVAAGKAIVTASGSGLTGAYHVWNDAALTSPAIDPTTTNGRKDRLVLRVTSGVPALEVVKGTASGSPAEPSITGDNYLELALITLPGSTTNITNAMITDRRAIAIARGSFAASSTDAITPAGGAPVRYNTDTATAEIWTGSAWVPIAQPGRGWSVITDTVNGGTATFDFTSIPATFTHLMLIGQVRSATAAATAEIRLRFNNDSGSNYDYAFQWLNAGSPAGTTGAAQTSALLSSLVTAASGTANRASPVAIEIPNYAATTFQKDCTAQVGYQDGSALSTAAGSAHWRSTAAISRITIISTSGAGFVAGSRMTLIGIR